MWVPNTLASEFISARIKVVCNILAQRIHVALIKVYVLNKTSIGPPFVFYHHILPKASIWTQHPEGGGSVFCHLLKLESLQVYTGSGSVSSVGCICYLTRRILHQTSPHATGSYSSTLISSRKEPSLDRRYYCPRIHEGHDIPTLSVACVFSFSVMSPTHFACRSPCVRLPLLKLLLSSVLISISLQAL